MKNKQGFNGFDGKTLGILGGGQLGRMIGLSAARLGLKIIIMDPNKNSPAFQVANEVIIKISDAIESILLNGLSKTMNQYNA